MKRFLAASHNTILTCAILHVIILVAWGLFTGDYQPLNPFTLLGVDLFIPGVSKGTVSFILGWLVIIGVGMIYYYAAGGKSAASSGSDN